MTERLIKNTDEYLRRRAELGRLSPGGDDRCDQYKLRADAELRGALGCHKANEIIAAIDRVRSFR